MTLMRFVPLAVIILVLDLGVLYLVVKLIRMAWGN